MSLIFTGAAGWAVEVAADFSGSNLGSIFPVGAGSFKSVKTLLTVSAGTPALCKNLATSLLIIHLMVQVR